MWRKRLQENCCNKELLIDAGKFLKIGIEDSDLYFPLFFNPGFYLDHFTPGKAGFISFLYFKPQASMLLSALYDGHPKGVSHKLRWFLSRSCEEAIRGPGKGIAFRIMTRQSS